MTTVEFDDKHASVSSSIKDITYLQNDLLAGNFWIFPTLVDIVFEKIHEAIEFLESLLKLIPDINTIVDMPNYTCID